MERKRKYRIVVDGPGYGVQRWSDIYACFEFVNDEPFSSREKAKEWLKAWQEEGEEPERDEEEERRLWARGFLEASQHGKEIRP